MIKKLKEHSSYYTTTEEEANTLIKNIKDQTGGDIVKQNIVKKHHKNYGDYFETTVVKEYTTSKSILERGY
ncbi:hypothetical protein [Aerococcus christensenii]|uniref:hypothetical protein n=1 Tax=Aerococcus christensenii TaxID=87541 RepID=UPI0023A956EF|nr:hypothetical protein [Aerococcus christensenii]WEB70565.1 hypothetical protein PUW42_05715 [Aerococcus christensenii]